MSCPGPCVTTVRVPTKPASRIRRFDVLAEYRKQQEQDEGMPTDQAKGYGLWGGQSRGRA
jgi:hypothetical protein